MKRGRSWDDVEFYFADCPKVSGVAYEASLLNSITAAQSSILTQNNFVNVFGAEHMKRHEINWSAIQNSTVDDPEMMLAMLYVESCFPGCHEGRPKNFHDLRDTFITMKDKIIALHEVRLEIEAENYFKKLYPHVSISFSRKIDGTRLGRCLTMNAGLPDERTYHIKTTSVGRGYDLGCGLHENLRSRPLDPRELMVYRFLEYLGIGCESHFFHRSKHDVYIATLDGARDHNSPIGVK